MSVNFLSHFRIPTVSEKLWQNFVYFPAWKSWKIFFCLLA